MRIGSVLIYLATSLLLSACLLSPSQSNKEAPQSDGAIARKFFFPFRKATRRVQAKKKPSQRASADHIEGLLDMDRVAQGKRLQATTLTDDKGHVHILSYRPMPEYYHFLERRVVVTGTRHSPGGQSVAGPHLQIKQIKLAEGVSAIIPGPRALPAPPFSENHAALQLRMGRWVRVRVTYQGGYRPEGDDWVEVNLAAPDGTRLRTRVYRYLFEGKWTRLKEKPFTIIGKLQPYTSPTRALKPKIFGKPFPAASFSLKAYVCGEPDMSCYSNVPLEGEGHLPQVLGQGRK